MSRIRTPENFEIAALTRSKQQGAAHDPMQPGVGTPWEDRGTHGAAGAYFKTVAASLLSPGKLADSIRRPETTSDARGFLIISAVCWGLSAALHGLIWMRGLADDPKIDFDRQTYLIETAIAAAAAGGGVWLLFKLYNAVYKKLVAQEKQQGVLSGALLYSTNAYALGPSVLAIIPLIGPPLAALWILCDLVAVGRARLRLRLAPAIIDAFVPFLLCGIITVAGYFVGRVVLHQLVGEASTPVPVSPDARPNSAP